MKIVELMEESKSGATVAMATSNQVSEKESSAHVVNSGVVIEKPSGEGSVQANDAGVSNPVQVRKLKQKKKNKLRKLKRRVNNSQNNGEKALTSDVGNKAEGEIKDNQNSVEKASISNVATTAKSAEKKRKLFGKGKRESEDGKNNDENLPTSNKRKKQDEIITEKGKMPRKELNEDLSKKGNKNKNVLGGDSERKNKRPHNELGGVIFMCNAKTKSDCFRHRVFGVPNNKKELVLRIKPGLMLFLYDFDTRLMHGVYKAASAGGMKLEPAAFGGSFPAQVRFVVEKDYLPIPEGVFKKAIKYSYDEKTHKFQPKLTSKEANRLAQLFGQVHGKSSHRELGQIQFVPLQYERQPHFIEHHVSHQDVLAHRPVSRHVVLPNRPLFLTENEYRNYGLQQGRSHVQPISVDFGSRSGREREQLVRHHAPIYVDDPGRERGQLQRQAGPVYVDDAGREREQLQRHPAIAYIDATGTEREQLQRHHAPIYVDDGGRERAQLQRRPTPIYDDTGREREQLQRRPAPIHGDDAGRERAQLQRQTVPIYVDAGREREQLQRRPSPIFVDDAGRERGQLHRQPPVYVDDAGREREHLLRRPAIVYVDDASREREKLQRHPATIHVDDAGREQEQLRRHPAHVYVEDDLPRREVPHRDQRVLDENEYKHDNHQLSEYTAMDHDHPLEEAFKRHDSSTTSLVDRYLSMPRRTGTDARSSSALRRETFVQFPKYSNSISGQPGRVIGNSGVRINSNPGTLQSLYDSRDLLARVPDYDQGYHQLRQDPGLPPPSIPSRYSLAGPSSLHR